jgi:hypothetical protein
MVKGNRHSGGIYVLSPSLGLESETSGTPGKTGGNIRQKTSLVVLFIALLQANSDWHYSVT